MGREENGLKPKKGEVARTAKSLENIGETEEVDVKGVEGGRQRFEKNGELFGVGLDKTDE